jgi:hypothetical protein
MGKKISLTDRVRECSTYNTENKANWIRYIFRSNCLLKHVIEEVTGRGERRRKQLPDDLKEKRRYCKLKEEAVDRTMWRTRFGRDYGPVVRQTTK